MHHATAIVTDPAVARSGPPTALPATEGFRDAHRRDMPTRGWCCASAFGICRQTFADGNVDRPVESANVDIPVRHPRGGNVVSVAICLPDAYVERHRPGRGDGIVSVEGAGPGSQNSSTRTGLPSSHARMSSTMAGK